MPEVEYIEHDGHVHRVGSAGGVTVMQAALDNQVPGIIGECGGNCACGTCHVYVEPAWRDKLPAASAMEDDMLDSVVDRQPHSRLGCQIVLNSDLNGLQLRLPASQR